MVSTREGPLTDTVSATRAEPVELTTADVAELAGDGLKDAYRHLAETAELVEALGLDPSVVLDSAFADLLRQDAEREALSGALSGALAAPPPPKSGGPARMIRLSAFAAAALALVLVVVVRPADDDPKTKGGDLLAPRVFVETTSIRGPLSARDVTAGFTSVARALEACAPAEGARLTGALVVGGDGLVARARFVGDESVAECVERAIAGASFALATTTSDVTVTLELHRVAE